MTDYNHILAGFSHGFKHRRALSKLMDSTPPDNCILDLDPAALKSGGISVLAVDFDGVLAPHGAAAPLPEAGQWLGRCRSVFGEDNIFILSNKPTEPREKWFREHFPRTRFISNVRKKPFPDGLEAIAAISGAETAAIIMIDDRLLTGCLAAIKAGVRPCYINRPYVSLVGNTFPELFFIAMRLLDRLFIRLCTTWKQH